MKSPKDKKRKEETVLLTHVTRPLEWNGRGGGGVVGLQGGRCRGKPTSDDYYSLGHFYELL